MTKEEKELLLIDLCARLPYRIKGNYQNSDDKLLRSITITYRYLEPNGMVMTGDIKPYLFPLSSMTEEQKKELFELCRFCIEEDWDGKKREVYAIEISSRADPAYCFDHNFYMWGVDIRAIDWLNKNHFDYRGLIEKGLAIDCTKLNIY
jgi:hypothetical protein